MKANVPDITNPMLVAALGYARKKWPVFPCDPKNKKPLTSHGFKDATTEAAMISWWWKKWPDAMIGVPMGERSGVWAADPDAPDNPAEPDGVAAWEKMANANGVPLTRVHSTPGGGRHVLFRWHKGKPITNGSGALPPGIHVRGDGGYIIVPPSRRADGKVYQVVDDSEPIDAPPWLCAAILNGKRGNSASSAISPDVAAALKGFEGLGISSESNDYLKPADPERIRAALAVIPSDDYQIWFEIGCAICREGAGFALFDRWSRKSTKYDADECKKKWRDCGALSRYTAGTIFHYASKFDPNWEPAPKPARAHIKVDGLIKRASDLRGRTFDPLRWIVPGLLPEGLTVLAGKPKKGKSFWALDVSIGVATGGESMGKRCEQGDVLALFLEDSDRRLQRRMTDMLGAEEEQWPERLEYATEWPPLTDGGSKLIRDWIGRVKKPRLIIVDILERVRTRAKSGQSPNQYSDDYQALMSLHRISTEFNLSVLVLHHQRKQGAEDMIDTVSGTLGLAGAADSILILGENEDGKFLSGRGRDLEEFSFAMRQGDNLRWEVLGQKQESHRSRERARIMAALAKAGRPMSVEEIAKETGGVKANVKNLIYKLHAEGDIFRTSHGIYKLPDAQAGLPLDDEI